LADKSTLIYRFRKLPEKDTCESNGRQGLVNKILPKSESPVSPFCFANLASAQAKTSSADGD
jgi:hypothetical protein